MTEPSKNPLAWDMDNEPDANQMKERARKAYEENHHFDKAFSTPSGRKVLEWLDKHTLGTPSWWPDADYNKAVANGFWREGQNSLVRQIKSKIEQARHYKEENND